MNMSLSHPLMSLSKTVMLAAAIFFVQEGSVEAATYYVSSHAGDDGNAGLSTETAWQSLEKVNSVVFQPGDSLLLASDSVFKGQLAPKGSGTMKDGAMVPIVLDRFGEGALPRIDGEGKVNAPLFLHNVEGWEIRNLEITNQGDERKQGRFGVAIYNTTMESARHIVLQGLFIHSVNGALPKHQMAGGAIYARCFGNMHRFDGLRIEQCHLKDCERNGMIVEGCDVRGTNWFPSINVEIRENLLEGIGGDGILVISCSGPLIEWNTMRDCPRYGEELGAAAGMWPWACDDAVFQFNEVSDHKAWHDGQAFDCDYGCRNTLYQYNYSHDNEGGFMLVCGPGFKKKYNEENLWRKDNALNFGSIVRYNLSINDGSRTTGGNIDYSSPTFSITGDSVQDTLIYNNVLILPKKSDPKMDTALLRFGKWGGEYAIHTIVKGNIFWVQDGQKGTFALESASNLSITDNQFYGDVDRPEQTDQIRVSGNVFEPELPAEVMLRGNEARLKIFRDFLEKKGNPHLKAGLNL